MLNNFISILCDVFVLWLERFFEYFFFYNNKVSHWTRFKTKRKHKLFIIKMIWNDLKILIIENLRECREAWTEHDYPERFYWHCWEDDKFLVILFFFLKIPTFLYTTHFWCTYPLQELHGWDYKHEKRMTMLPVRLSIYYGEGNNQVKFNYFTRPYYETKYSWIQYVYKFFFYYLVWACCLKNYLIPFCYRLQYKGVKRQQGVDREFFEWESGAVFLLFLGKYITYITPNDIDYNFQHTYGGIYGRNIKLQTKYVFKRGYWLCSDLKIGDPEPTIKLKPLEKDDAKRQWAKNMIKYENITIRETVDNKIASWIITSIVFVATTIFFAVLHVARFIWVPLRLALIVTRDFVIIILKIVIIVLDKEF